MSMSITPDNFNSEPAPEHAVTETRGRWMLPLVAILTVFSVGQGIYSWSLHSRIGELESAMHTQITTHDQSIQELREFAKISDEDFAKLQQELTTTQNHLGNAQTELRRTRVAADQLAKQQKEAADQFASKIGMIEQEQASTKGAVGGLSTDMTGVKQEVSLTKQDLATTRSDLQRAIGDLGVQSGLIATNRQELAELRQIGERDYFEFDLRKVKQPQKFGGNVALTLKKADVKGQKYTIELTTDDKRVEKKDKNVNEPVQFYQQGYRQPTELVVNQILKDRIVGYISVPKGRSTNGQRPMVSAAIPSGS